MSRWTLFVISLSGWCLVGLGGAHAAPSAELAATDGCGGVLPSKADGSTWECTFDDEFDGDSLDRSKWVPQTRHSSGTDEARACNVDDPQNVNVSDGALRLTVRKATAPMVCDRKPADYTAGNVSTYHRFSQQYGRFEARVKSADATVPGLQESFWLWPDERESHVMWWATSGEIDVAETYSHHPKLAIPYLHTAINTVVPRPGHNTAWDCKADRGAYNTYTLTWTPQSLMIDVNGETCLVNRSGNRTFHKKYIAAFTSALGTGNRNALTPETPVPATMSVDYFRVWR